MVIDTSAVLAVLQDEPERRAYNELIENAPERRMSAASFVEASIVVESRFGSEGLVAFDLWRTRAGIVIHPVDEEQARTARRAFRDYGRGRHGANLNFGDCFSYALAITLAEPLLFKGDDFSETDVESAA